MRGSVFYLLASLVLVVFGMAQAALKKQTNNWRRARRNCSRKFISGRRPKKSSCRAARWKPSANLVGGVAHDFNNLLTVVLSGLRLMERNPDPARHTATTEAMRQAVERGAGLTRQLLAFARRQTLKPEVIDLGGRLIGMRNLLERSLRADILVDIHVAEDLWPVKSDPTQLELAIINLAVNARDAMPKGGVLTISAENIEGEKGEFVEVSVRDTGIGMSEAVKSRVFEPYFTTKQAGQGTGLGLAQVYGIVTQGGGTVRVESVENVGTAIILCLPRSMEPVKAVEALRPSAPIEAIAGKTILIVEDDDAVAGVVEALVRDVQCEPTRAVNAAAALDILSAGRRFDLYLLGHRHAGTDEWLGASARNRKALPRNADRVDDRL